MEHFNCHCGVIDLEIKMDKTNKRLFCRKLQTRKNPKSESTLYAAGLSSEIQPWHAQYMYVS